MSLIQSCRKKEIILKSFITDYHILGQIYDFCNEISLKQMASEFRASITVSFVFLLFVLLWSLFSNAFDQRAKCFSSRGNVMKLKCYIMFLYDEVAFMWVFITLEIYEILT